jgi:hypothetical protein
VPIRSILLLLASCFRRISKFAFEGTEGTGQERSARKEPGEKRQEGAKREAPGRGQERSANRKGPGEKRQEGVLGERFGGV